MGNQKMEPVFVQNFRKNVVDKWQFLLYHKQAIDAEPFESTANEFKKNLKKVLDKRNLLSYNEQAQSRAQWFKTECTL